MRSCALELWKLGHRRHDGLGSYCRWCGLETRHIEEREDAFTGETVHVFNTSCPIYRLGAYASR